MSLTFLRGQVGFMKTKGMTVHALSSPGPDLQDFGESEDVPIHAVAMTRRVTPLRDLMGVIEIWKVIRELNPMIVHAHTPKGGLLGMIAAFGTGARVRIYQMRGLPFVTARGFRRSILRLSELLSCRLAHIVLCNSHSMRQIAVDEGLCPPHKIEVLQGGSGNGVDATARFNPTIQDPGIRRKTRENLCIPLHATVIGFVGRIVKEKGIGELEEAWRDLREVHPDAHLLMVGPFESRDQVPGLAVERLQKDPRVHLVGMEWNTPPLYAAMDLVVLPTYREGFPNVPLESAAMGLPVVATSVPGCTDAVQDGRTGLLVPPRDSRSLANAVNVYLNDAALRRRHGEAGRERVLRDFRQELIWESIYSVYERCACSAKTSRTKRTLDIAASVLGLMLLLPLLGVLALIIRFFMGSPILFRQQRPGLEGRPFTMYKFRTMRREVDDQGNLLADKERITPFGQFLRQTSLDELPELWNVLRGDMSLVGPRPLLTEYLDLYSDVQARRHEVRPGITGWAQVNGRNATTWKRRLELDVWYVDHQSLGLDLRILGKTLLTVLQREGINQAGVATMERFGGTSG